MKLGLFWARSRRSVQIDTRSFCSTVRRRGTNFAVTRLICKSSVRIFGHVLNAILTSSATSLIVRRRSARMISRKRATVSSVWEVDGLPGRGSLLKDQRPLLKWDYHSNILDRLRQDSPKAACSISYVSAPDFPRRKQKSMDTHTLLHFIVHREMRRTLQVDVHWKTSTERMRGDTYLRFCTYTCRELTRFPLCCDFATCYSFPGKKSVPGLNDQPTYITHGHPLYLVCPDVFSLVELVSGDGVAPHRITYSFSYFLFLLIDLFIYSWYKRRAIIQLNN